MMDHSYSTAGAFLARKKAELFVSVDKFSSRGKLIETRSHFMNSGREVKDVS